MAKQSAPPTAGSHRMSSSIERAENGFVIHVSSEGGKGKNRSSSRTFVAPNGRAAMRIAHSHIQMVGAKLKQKKAKGKSAGKKR